MHLVGLCFLDRGFNRVHVLAVRHAQHLPAVGLEAGLHTFRKGDVRAAFDGDLVVVVQVDQLAQAQGAGQGGGFRGHAFHQVAVGDKAVGVVVDHREVRLVVPGCQHAFRQGKAYAHGKAVAQGAGGYVHPGGDAVFRMARGLAAPLPEVFQVVKGQIVACQVQHGVQQRRAVARGQDEAVPVEPFGVRRIIFHKFIPYGIHQGRCAQRESGVPGFCLLYFVCREEPQGLYAFFMNGCHGVPPDFVLFSDIFLTRI